MRCLVYVFGGFWDWDYASQLPYVWYYVGVKSSFQHVNCLVKQFAMCLGVVAILLLNVMDVFSVDGGALLDRSCMVFQIMCVLCL